MDLDDPDANSKERREEENMMRDALEGLPDWRSEDGDWGRRGDERSNRIQEEQDLVDAISKRTRAHYSLADMSLDQLETFLQESDEEDYFQNVDDEEEYRKFLAAVQENVGAQDGGSKEKVIESSESEDEDADFEVEIEEALESDIEESLDGISRKRKRARRPVTREKRRKRESLQNRVLLSGRSKAPLRPLLPCARNVSVSNRSRFSIGSAARPWITNTKIHPLVCGFTAHQIGQLYCLMHEHVQLLLQVYVMCKLEPTMQQTAVDTYRMLMELVEKREAVLSWKRCAFPDFCFRPPYIHPSVAEDGVSCFQNFPSKTPQVVGSKEDVSSARMTSSLGPGDSGMSVESICPIDGRHSGATFAESLNSSSGQIETIDNAFGSESALSASPTIPVSLPLEWVPASSGPVRSLMDVAPLALVREFTAVVEKFVETRKQHSQDEASEHSLIPLFSVRLQVSDGSKSTCERIKARSSSPRLKKTMAAALVESAKKQTLAMVPKDIAVAMERFCPLFNKSLFPHKAPPAAVANRLLFTDAEDELLAMGLMTYNNDWKAIQERFLPSKSMHQIFVRQKNRSSARAPQNSIKAVRKMKLSPLTSDEIVCIEEALKVYKYDWAKVCHNCVPHRDPATLPRQWRIALGTQKSYKSNMNSKDKRRLCDAGKREGLTGTVENFLSLEKVYSEPCNKAGCSRHNEEMVKSQPHDGFSSDLCTSTSRRMSGKILTDTIGPLATYSRQRNKDGNWRTDSFSRCPGTHDTRSKSSRCVNSKVYTSQPCISRATAEQTVKLAPGLPPLKLPSTVRVLTHSEKSQQPVLDVHRGIAKTGSKHKSNNSCLRGQN
nr:DUO pollen 3-like protein [Physcomitrium patens]